MRQLFTRLSLALALAAAVSAPALAANPQANVYAAVGSPGNALLTNSAVQVGPAGQRNLGGVTVYNPNGAVEYIQLFDALSGSVSLGTTVPKMVLPIPATTAVSLNPGSTGGVTFFTGIAAAATTAAIGTSAPATGLTANITYQ